MTDNIKGMKLDWSLNISHILTVLAAVFGMFVYFQNMRSDVDRLSGQLKEMYERGSPQTQLIAQADKVQNERIQNLAQMAQQSVSSREELLRMLAQIREDIAVIKVELRMPHPQHSAPTRN